MGKVIEASLVHHGGEDYSLVGTIDVWEDLEEVEMPDGSVLMKQGSRLDSRPFAASKKARANELVVGIDPSNFPEQAFDAFFSALPAESGFRSTHHVRKAPVPDPEVIIHLTNGLVAAVMAYLAKPFANEVAKKTAGKLGDDLGNLYDLVRSVIETASSLAVPKNRPVTYVITAPGDPIVELVAQGKSQKVVLSAIQPAKFAKCIQDAMV